ncbi:uncharacterized protein LOC106154740 [Lingula anatina]|uniref:Uncharacterized protein LOC106154740 n=1 Tax=Lingula anatina TaxID=7574 RepID=A0A1S3HF03_LINAN|nr:uncharacterized protein LOC106154740 [Lingula anatina]|eukprot:XP_013384652.1 uncharacterized protein LOC106154740 [Lingula anatina]
MTSVRILGARYSLLLWSMFAGLLFNTCRGCPPEFQVKVFSCLFPLNQLYAQQMPSLMARSKDNRARELQLCREYSQTQSCLRDALVGCNVNFAHNYLLSIRLHFETNSSMGLFLRQCRTLPTPTSSTPDKQNIRPSKITKASIALDLKTSRITSSTSNPTTTGYSYQGVAPEVKMARPSYVNYERDNVGKTAGLLSQNDAVMETEHVRTENDLIVPRHQELQAGGVSSNSKQPNHHALVPSDTVNQNTLAKRPNVIKEVFTRSTDHLNSDKGNQASIDKQPMGRDRTINRDIDTRNNEKNKQSIKADNTDGSSVASTTSGVNFVLNALVLMAVLYVLLI